MLVTMLFLAATLALLVYTVASRLPLPAPPRPVQRRTLLTPLEDWLHRELQQARLNLPPRTLIDATLLAAGLGAALASPFHNGLLMAISAGACGLAPFQAVRVRLKARARAVNAAAAPALVQIARLCEVRGHPLLALTDALPMLQMPLKAEFERALAQTQAGAPLPEALRELAARCYNNFYLHQLAELVAIHIRQGGDLAGALQRLADRMRTLEELRAEETAELFGYKLLTRLLFGAALLPLPYWALTRSPSLKIYLENPLAQGLLIWVLVSGLAITSLPYWMAIED